MTVAGMMDPTEARTETEIVELLRAMNRKLDRVEGVLDALQRRVEGLEELREDLWPTIHGASHAISRKLHELDQQGALGFAMEGVHVLERVATAFTREDVRLLGENVVGILNTVRNLTQPEIMAVADKAAGALSDPGRADGRLGLVRALRDPHVRRGMTLMLSVLRELGGDTTQTPAAARAAAQR